MKKYTPAILVALSLIILTACSSTSVDSVAGVANALVATAQSSEQNSDDAGETSSAAATPTAAPTATPTETPTATLTPTPTATPIPPTATPTPESSPCSAVSYQTRLSIGQRAHVLPVPPVANTVRHSPDKSTQKTGDIQPNGAMTILDGPKCANSWFWWYVQADNGVTGWTPEGERGEYWLAPGEPTAEPPVTSPPAPGTARDVNLRKRPGCGKEQTVSSADQIMLNAFWGAKGQDLTRMSNDVINMAILLDDQRLSSSRSPVLLSASEVPCGTSLSGSYWLVESAYVGSLSPGRYRVTVQYTFGEQLTDGYDNNRDGRPDSYGPGGDHSIVSTDYIIVVR